MNFPGLLASSAAVLLFPYRPGDSGTTSSFTGFLDHRLPSQSRFSGCRPGTRTLQLVSDGQLADGEFGSFASRTTPAYSEWSVTPTQSRGV